MGPIVSRHEASTVLNEHGVLRGIEIARSEATSLPFGESDRGVSGDGLGTALFLVPKCAEGPVSGDRILRKDVVNE